LAHRRSPLGHHVATAGSMRAVAHPLEDELVQFNRTEENDCPLTQATVWSHLGKTWDSRRSRDPARAILYVD
jgi:hypothetical protein